MRVLTWLVAFFVVVAVGWFVMSPRSEPSSFPIPQPATVTAPSVDSGTRPAPSPTTATPTTTTPPATPPTSTKTSASQQLLIRGVFVIEGKEPDGDSVRFIAADPTLYRQLTGASRIKVSGDGSVQLRFEGIDAPEVHYGKLAQPQGNAARDALLALLGFRDVVYKTGGKAVQSARPASVRGAILSKAAEVNGRPIAYALLESGLPAARNGTWLTVDDALLRKTLNARMLETGAAYLTVYGSTPKAHRATFREIALRARAARLGVWAADRTGSYTLRTQDDIGANGQLILPKLFRRSSDYLRDVQSGKFRGTLPAWLEASEGTNRPENDSLSLNGQRGRLSTLLEQQGDRVRFLGDVLDLVFAEK